MNIKNQTNLGIFYALFAFVFWGLVPIYFKAVSSVPALQVLMHRIIWSVLFLLLMLAYKKELHKIFLILKNAKISFYLFVSSVIIAFNWLTYIWAISHNQMLEASLGYYISPLVTIFFGLLFLQESTTKNQKIAIFVAFLALIFQLYSLRYFPLTTLLLAVTFPTYGLVRKKINVSSLIGLFIETLFLLPFALGYFLFLIQTNQNFFSLQTNFNVSVLLFCAGFITIIPLLAFNSATIRLKFSTIGFFQYIGPSVSLLLAIFVYNETLSAEKMITFSLIWFALFIASLDTIKGKKT